VNSGKIISVQKNETKPPHCNFSCDIFRVNPKIHQIEMYWRDDTNHIFGSIGALKNYLEENDKELLFATNGGMYHKERDPVGLYIEKGIEFKKLDTTSDKGNFYKKPNGVFYVGFKTFGIIETMKYNTIKDSIIYATQSGPLLVFDNQLHPSLDPLSKHKYIRSGVGINSKNEVVFAISDIDVTFYCFATYFRSELDCKNVLYLDGDISKMYIEGTPRQNLDGNLGPIIAIMRKK
jgi:uncharacterized protein YigE (DUF2233 family)